MEESERATIFLKAESHLMDEIFRGIADLLDVLNVLAADIRYHSVCLEFYLRRYERSLMTPHHFSDCQRNGQPSKWKLKE